MVRNPIKAAAVGISLIVFVVLYFCLAILTHVMGWQITSFGMLFLINAISWFVWLIPGYVAASLAKTRGVLNGVVVGIGATLLQGLDYLLRSGSLAQEFVEHWYLFLIYGVVLSGLGGLLWDVKTLIKTRRLKSSQQIV